MQSCGQFGTQPICEGSWFLNVPLAEVGRYAVAAAVHHGGVWRHAGALSL